jgi:hypothetical protein
METNSTEKENRGIYLLFFAIGILSLPISLFLGGVLTSANLINVEGAYQLLFALLTCSILFAIGLYAFKERSFRFALKAFTIATVASFSIFYGSLFSGLLLAVRGVLLFPVLLLLIIFVLGSVAFKERPLVGFTLRAFAVSFVAIFLIFNVFLMWGAYQHEHAKAIDVDELNYTPSEYVEISDTELEDFPALKEAVFSQRPVKTPPEEWRNLRDLIEHKSLAKYNETWTNAVKIDEKYYSIRFMTA